MPIRYNILPTRATFFISSVGKIESVREFKIKFLSTYFVVGESHTKIICFHALVFNKNDILYF